MKVKYTIYFPPLYFPQRGKILKFYINNKISLSLWERDQG